MIICYVGDVIRKAYSYTYLGECCIQFIIEGKDKWVRGEQNLDNRIGGCYISSWLAWFIVVNLY
jgi:hypothetical protein